MFIGLTGPLASGKSEVVRYFVSKGFSHISLSDMVREECKKRKMRVTRENLIEIGNELRNMNGAGVLGVRAREFIEKKGGNSWIVDGIRNPSEAVELQKIPSFLLLALNADHQILVDRVLSRARLSDSSEKEEILLKIRREWGVGEPENGQQVGKCVEMADYTIVNEGEISDLHKDIEKFLHLYQNEKVNNF